MKIERKRILEQIEVEDSIGGKHTVMIYQTSIEVPPSDRGYNRFPDWRHRPDVKVTLSDKRPLNVIDDDTFQIVTTGEILKRVK